MGPYSVPASLLPPRCLTHSPSPLARLGHNIARRLHSPAPAQPPVTAPVTARAATAQSLPRELLSPGHRQPDAASDPSGQDLILVTGFKVRCELIPAKQTFNSSGLRVTVFIKLWFNWLNTCEPTSGYHTLP